MKRFLCRLLIVVTVLSPFQLAQAGMIASDQAVQDRAQVGSFLDRAEVSARLQGLGVDPAAVRARVNALTDAEAADLARRIDAMPAGAFSDAMLLVWFIVILGIFVWWMQDKVK